MLRNFLGPAFSRLAQHHFDLVGARLILWVHKKRDCFPQIALLPLRHSPHRLIAKDSARHFSEPGDGCDNRNSFLNVLILIEFLGAINHNDIDGAFLRI